MAPEARGEEDGIWSKIYRNKWHQVRSNFMRERGERLRIHQDQVTAHRNPRKTISNAPETVEENLSSETTDTLDISPTPSPPTTEEPTMGSSHKSYGQNTASNVLVGDDAGIMKPTHPSSATNILRKETNKMDLSFLEELRKLREKRITDENDPNLLFLFSSLPMMKQLSPPDNIDIKLEIDQAFRGKLFPPAPPH